MSKQKSLLVPRRWLQGGSSKPTKIKIMQWNVLADALSHSGPTSNFIKAPTEILQWKNRKEKLLEEILRSEADIVCLEEVDHFHDFFQPKLRENGFEGIFKPKPSSPCLRVGGNSGPDGCAMFYKTEKFTCLEKQELSLQNKNGKETNQVALLVKFEVHKATLHEVCDVPTTDPSLKKFPSSLQLCVAVTHLKAKAEAVNKRTAQGVHLYSAMKEFCGDLPGVVCGDFNALPTEPVYAHFKESSVWLESSYFTAYKGVEPLMTSWKFRPEKVSKYTIDYIWYTVHQLQVDAVWEIPSETDIGENGMPGWTYPSDHIALCTCFTF